MTRIWMIEGLTSPTNGPGGKWVAITCTGLQCSHHTKAAAMLALQYQQPDFDRMKKHGMYTDYRVERYSRADE